MWVLSHDRLRMIALAVVIGAALASPRAVRDLVTRADSRTPAPTGDGAQTGASLKGVRPTPVPWGTPPERAPQCSVSVGYADDVQADRRVTLTDLVADRDCPSLLNTTVGLTFEVDNPKPRRNLWWRRAESSFDVLYPSSGSITAVGKNRVSLSNLVLDQMVTIDVLEGDQRLMSFTLKHF